MHRRHFLHVAGSASLIAAARASLRAEVQTLTIIDAHTHVFDPQRPQGVPWPGKDSPLYRPTYVRDYMKQPVATPVTGTVVIEASPWVEDNQWVLDLARTDRFIVGLCGNLDPKPSPLSRGCRRRSAAWSKPAAGHARPFLWRPTTTRVISMCCGRRLGRIA